MSGPKRMRRLTDNQLSQVIGVLPVAGLGTRLYPLCYPKELLPIGVFTGSDGSVSPKLLIDDSLESFAAAGITHATAIISPSKLETIKYLGDGARHDVSMNYRVQAEPFGLAHACSLIDRWFGVAVLALPDTVVRPREAFRKITRNVQSGVADLSLAVFPTDTPEQLGPVQFDKNGVVARIWDKPRRAEVRNAWAAAAWSARFDALLKTCVEKDPSVILGDVFQLAVESGLSVNAEYFPDGSFTDLGTRSGIASFLQDRDLSEPALAETVGTA